MIRIVFDSLIMEGPAQENSKIESENTKRRFLLKTPLKKALLNKILTIFSPSQVLIDSL